MAASAPDRISTGSVVRCEDGSFAVLVGTSDDGDPILAPLGPPRPCGLPIEPVA